MNLGVCKGVVEPSYLDVDETEKKKRLLGGTVPPKKVKTLLVGTIPPKMMKRYCRNSPTKKKNK